MSSGRQFTKSVPISAAATATTAVAKADVATTGWYRLTVIAEVAATTTTTDLTLAVIPYCVDGATLAGTAPLVPLSTATVKSDGTNVWTVQIFDLGGIDKVSVQVTNGNAGTKNVTVNVFEQA